MSLCNNDNWKEVRRDVKLPSEIWCFYKEWEQLASQLSWLDYSANKELRVGNKDFLITYDDVSNARTEARTCAPKQVFTKLLLCTRNDEVNVLSEELSVTEDLAQKLETI